MLFFFKRKKRRRKVYTELHSISFCGNIDKNIQVVIKFPEDPTLFSFSLPGAHKTEAYFKGSKYGIYEEKAQPFIAEFLKYTKKFPEDPEKLKKIDFKNTALIDFELNKELAGTTHPFRMRIGFDKKLYPALNIIYMTENPKFPYYYENVVENFAPDSNNIEIHEQKTKRGWAWEFLRYRGMNQKKKILVVDLTMQNNIKIKKIIQEKVTEKWFPVFFDELHDTSLDQKIALLLVADRFLFDTSYYAYFAVKEGILSFKIGNMPYPTDNGILKIITPHQIEEHIR